MFVIIARLLQIRGLVVKKYQLRRSKSVCNFVRTTHVVSGTTYCSILKGLMSQSSSSCDYKHIIHINM